MAIMTLVEDRIDRLAAASLRRIIEPETELAGAVGPGMVLPRELLSVSGLELGLTEEQWERLAREELASILDAGIRFESMLMAGFGLMLADHRDLTDPRVNYILHEIGEEARHSRLFARVIAQLEPTADNVFTRGLLRRLDRLVSPRAIQRKALFCIMVLTGEEGPDLIQKRCAEHPLTDPFVREFSRYHRLEEARHLSFARMLLPELWRQASATERWVVRLFGPAIMAGVFDSLVQPGVYRTVGIPGWRTWNAVRKSEARRELRAEACRPVMEAMRAAGAFGRRDRPPRSWRRVCRVDAFAAART
jgi:hypothetical protein